MYRIWHQSDFIKMYGINQFLHGNEKWILYSNWRRPAQWVDADVKQKLIKVALSFIEV